MHSEIRERGETDILTFDVADEALERAAAVMGGPAMTIAYCKHWYGCGWPLEPNDAVRLWPMIDRHCHLLPGAMTAPRRI